jgi:K+-sensing histidine kinase KdpD
MSAAPPSLAPLLALLVHDLRNPVATIGANLSYVSEAAHDALDADTREALADSTAALYDLMAGLDHLAFLSRHVAGEPAAAAADGSVADALRALPSRIRTTGVQIVVEDATLRARGAQALPRLVEVLLANSGQHAAGKPVIVRARRDGEHVVVEVEDKGRAIAPELRDVAFTAAGQLQIKERSDGRYGRSLGLFAAGLLAQAMGARLEAAGSDGAAILRVVLTPA